MAKTKTHKTVKRNKPMQWFVDHAKNASDLDSFRKTARAQYTKGTVNGQFWRLKLAGLLPKKAKAVKKANAPKKAVLQAVA